MSRGSLVGDVRDFRTRGLGATDDDWQRTCGQRTCGCRSEQPKVTRAPQGTSATQGRNRCTEGRVSRLAAVVLAVGGVGLCREQS